MIYGVGVDIVSNERIRKIYNRFGMKFLRKFLTEQEIEYCLSQRDPIPHIAVRFAAKEAIIKALRGQARYKEIEISKGSDKAPEASVITRKDIKIYISLSHEKDYSIAFAVLVPDLIN